MDRRISELVTNRAAPAIDARASKFNHELQRTEADLADRNVLNPGMAISVLDELAARHLQELVEEVVEAIAEVIDATSPVYSEALAAEPKQLSSSLIPEQLSLAMPSGNTSSGSRAWPGQARRRARAIAKADSDIDILVERLKKPRESPTATITVHGNIDVLQVGDHAMADVRKGLDVEDLNTVLQSMTALLEELVESSAVPTEQYAELSALVEEARAEVAKAKPNITRIQSTAVLLGSAVQSIAALGPAYATARSAFALIGVHLP